MLDAYSMYYRKDTQFPAGILDDLIIAVVEKPPARVPFDPVQQPGFQRKILFADVG